MEKYGHLTTDGPRYPLLSVKAGDFSNGKPNILIIAGVHGYEPSGIMAALNYLENLGDNLNHANYLIYPTISPWAYEFDHRWNEFADDPNRCFGFDKPWTDECRWFMHSVLNHNIHFDAAIDLHETPNRDIELRKSRASRYGTQLEEYWQVVPQGSYLMTSSFLDHNREARLAFGRAVINAMSHVSPIAHEDKILGKNNHGGVTISNPVAGTMRGFLDKFADHVGVTEVYPDHPQMSATKAVETQLAAIRGAVSFVHR